MTKDHTVVKLYYTIFEHQDVYQHINCVYMIEAVALTITLFNIYKSRLYIVPYFSFFLRDSKASARENCSRTRSVAAPRGRHAFLARFARFTSPAKTSRTFES